MEIRPHESILQAFGIEGAGTTVEKFGSGHINNTFLVKKEDGTQLILQRINTAVFKDPAAIARNQRMAADYLALHHPDYLFITPVPTLSGNDLFVYNNNEYWRVIPFIDGSVTVDQADDPAQAFQAAQQFGRLARYLDGIDIQGFKPAIPDFHNLTLRYNTFKSAIIHAAEERRLAAAELIKAFLQHADIAATYERLVTDPQCPDRLMHHDTKINNVLLQKGTYKGLCVCDLDTLMPGKLISDLGDMVRTYVSPVSEEEPDVSRITIREEYYHALMDGYLSEVGGALTPVEKAHLYYAGPFLVYMQGIRFLTDYLQGDVYYPVKHPQHNYNRAVNQLTLLERLQEKQGVLQEIIDTCLTKARNDI
ncbi:MAG TPA: aminoglycoside phosphotransferase family protein [Chitinophaga sp.]|uniref:phosphotransferase enzyme family protein n=1 Tax=Chitinophaga sp. TaxID=1869181 RepID=UPI002DBC8F1F|nr:aminoglycoside phosphotransferase family protein [Chitinophaga sp.]HEU4553363.1 aminoglycoside phosphotransferase family protein [Chitinophaga sp.]